MTVWYVKIPLLLPVLWELLRQRNSSVGWVKYIRWNILRSWLGWPKKRTSIDILISDAPTLLSLMGRDSLA